MKNSTFLQHLEQILRVLKNSFSFQKTISKSDIFNSETKKTIYCLEVLDRSKRNFFHFFIGIALFLCGTISWAQPIVTDGSPVDWPNYVDVPGANRVHIFDLVNSSNDGGYTGGTTKDGNDFSSWKWKQGQQNDKMDIQNAGAYLSGDKLYFFADRFSNSGDAAIGIWILQNKVSPSGTGTSGSGDPFTGVHQDGDVLIVSHFVNGGSVDDRKAYRWENGALNTTPIALDITSLYTIVNTVDVAAPTSPTDWNYVPKSGVADVYPANSFFEGFIDLNIANITLDPCTTTFLFETRESQSLSSILVDFANGQLNNVPSAPVATTGERCGSGPVSFTATGCSGEGTELKWYDAATNGNLVYTGATYNVSITGTTSYWVSCSVGGCEGPRTQVTRVVNALPTIDGVVVNVTCNGANNGSINVTASGGIGPYTYDWADVVGTIDSEDRTALAPGFYTVIVTDSKGCTASVTKEITQPSAITASAVANNPLCFGVANTGFTITASGGTGDLEYSKDNGANYVSSGVFTGLTAGTYNWVVRDENGCTKTGTVEVTIPAVVELSLTSQPETCEGTDSGSIEATFSGGTGVYRVSIDGGTLTEQTSPYTFSNLSSGLHTVLVKDFNDCELSKEINVGLILCELNCTYTQGYYGNEGGISCANNESHTTRELIEMALDTYPSDVMRIGSLGRSVVVSKTEIDITAVIKVLPGGGNSKALMSGNYSISDLPPNYLKKGVINNSLLAQTITLGLNLGISEQLGNFALQAGELATAAPEGGCGSTIPLVRECNPDGSVNNDYGYFDIKSSVVNALSDKTVRGLFDLANKALAGESVGVSLADLTYVVDKINNAFDGCRIFIGYNVGRLSCPVLTNTILTTSKVATTTTTTKTVAPDVKTSEVTTEKAGFSAYPVPFRDVLTLRYNFNYMSSVKIEVFNSRGILVFSKIDPDGYLNKEISLNLNVNKGSSQVYVVKLTTNQGSTVKKVLSSK